jgi:cytochrome c biogenesis protein CcdA
MPISDQEYAARAFLFTSIIAVVLGTTLVVIGIVSLVTYLLGTALTVVAFASGGLAFGMACHLTWLRYRLRRDANAAR